MSGYNYGEIDKKLYISQIFADKVYQNQLRSVADIAGKQKVSRTTNQTYNEAIEVLRDKKYATKWPGLYIAQMRILQASWLALSTLSELGLDPKNIDVMSRIPDATVQKLAIATSPTVLLDSEMTKVIKFEKPDYRDGEKDWQRETDMLYSAVSKTQIPIQVVYDSQASRNKVVVKSYQPLFKWT